MRITVATTYDKGDLNAAASTDDKVYYVYTITNNGFLTLFNIAIEADGLIENAILFDCMDTDGQIISGSNLGRLEGLATYPSGGVSPSTSLACNATDSVSQEEVMGETL